MARRSQMSAIERAAMQKRAEAEACRRAGVTIPSEMESARTMVRVYTDLVACGKPAADAVRRFEEQIERWTTYHADDPDMPEVVAILTQAISNLK